MGTSRGLNPPAADALKVMDFITSSYHNLWLAGGQAQTADKAVVDESRTFGDVTLRIHLELTRVDNESPVGV